MTAMRKKSILTRLRRFGTTTMVAGSVGFISACAQVTPAPAAGQEPLVITQRTNLALQQYLQKVASNRGGAFAVSPDGVNSYYVFCPDVVCSPGLYGGIAKTQCYSASGQECILFFVRNQPRRAYTVSPDTTVGHHGYRRAVPLDELPINNRD
ncbi:hypothetical protein [Dongia sp.]|uniref:hypothetical protein n=1 Tax=Dongia sp. TaxID=1977262 RepID=UPI0035AF72E1